MSTTGSRSTNAITSRVEANIDEASGFDFGSKAGCGSPSGSRWLRAIGLTCMMAAASFAANTGWAQAYPQDPFFLQTNSAATGAGTGDWYTSGDAGAGNGAGFLTFQVPAGWSAGDIVVDLLSPECDPAAYSDGNVTNIVDEDNAADTTFQLYVPGSTFDILNPSDVSGLGLPLVDTTYSGSLSFNQWQRFATIVSPVPGTYVLRVTTDSSAGSAQNGYRVRVGVDANDVLTAPDPSANFDGLDDTGDELFLATPGLALQQNTAGNVPITFYRFVPPGLPQIQFHTFDSDGIPSIRYYSPSQNAGDPLDGTAGTLSGADGTWNGGGTASARGGDTILNPEGGYWRVVMQVSPNNQFNLESVMGQPLYNVQPPTPIVELTKVDNKTDRVIQGEQITYTITYTNTSDLTATPGNAYNVIIKDTLPANASYDSSLAVGTTVDTSVAGEVTFTLTDELEPGETGTITVVAIVNGNASGLTVENSLEATFTDSQSHNYSVSASETTPLNQPPVANPVNLGNVATEDITYNAPAGTLGGTDQNSDTLIPSLATPPSPSVGTVDVEDDGSFEFIPAANYHGPVTFTYTLNDGYNDSAPATVTFSVAAVNDPPVANNAGVYTITEDSNNEPNPYINLITNGFAYDPDGDPVQVEAGDGVNGGAPPVNGTVVLVNTGEWVFVPTTNYYGPASFTYRAFNSDQSSWATVSLLISPTNDAPVANDDNYTTQEDDPIVRDLRNNDIDAETPDPTTLETIFVSTPGNGTAVILPDGRVRYTPNPNFFGTDSFNYAISDGADSSNVASVTINVTSVNDAPVALDDFYVTGEDQTLDVPVELSVLANDSDVEDTTLVAVTVSTPSHGTVTLNPDGTFSYVPMADFTGVDTFTYNVTDTGGETATATVTITVGSLNDEPVALNDAYSVNENGTLTQGAPGVLDNDSDPDGDTTTASLVTYPAHGALTSFNEAGNFEYTPLPGFVGVDTFTYQTFDAEAMSNVATVTITVNNVVDGPTANTDLYSTLEDTVLTVPASGVLANDFSPEGYGLSASLSTPAEFGTVELNSDGSFTYTPAANFNTTYTGFTDIFEYTVSDGHGNTATSSVEITVTSVIEQPVAVDDNYTLQEDNTFDSGFIGSTILINDSFETGGFFGGLPPPFVPGGPAPGGPSGVVLGTAMSAVIVQDNVDHGELNLYDGPLDLEGGLLGGVFSYTPDENFSGTDSFTYYIATLDPASMQILISNSATVTFNVVAENDEPVANNNNYSTLEDVAINVPAPGVLSNDEDVDGDTLSALIEVFPTNGTAVLNTDGSLTYTPNANYNGPDSLRYRASDGTLQSERATVNFNITSVNDTPVAGNDSYTVAEGGVLTVPTLATGLLANDTDPDGDALTASILAVPAHGTVSSFSLNGLFIYTPDAEFAGTDTFTYTITDGQASAVGTVTITVTPVNDPPTGVANTYATAEDTQLTVGAPGVLANDSDIDGDTLTAVLLTNVSNGTLTFAGDGSFTYEPNADFNGSDSFTYNVNDGTVNSPSVTVTITVNEVGDSPIAVDDSYVVDEDTSLTLNGAAGILNNDSDPDGDGMTARLVSGPAHGTLFLKSNGALDYKAHPNFNGSDSFTYYVTDGGNDSELATVNITVVAVEDAPTVSPNFYATPEDTQLTVAAPGVLSDDYDADGQALSAVIGSASAGAVTLNADGSFVYTPVANFVGTDEFTYTATDGTTVSAVTTVTIVIGSANDAPVANNDNFSGPEGAANINIGATGVLANDNDGDLDLTQTLTPIVIHQPVHGMVYMEADGSFVYDPYSDLFNGTDSFTYQVFDGELESNLATVTINVTSVNNAPEAADDFYTVAEDNVLNIAASGVLANDYDPEGDALSAALTTPPANGTVALNPDGSFTYTPQANYSSDFSGSADSFTYTVTDANGGVDTATVDIYVVSVIDQPVAVSDNYTLNEDEEFDSGFIGASVLLNDTFETGGMLNGFPIQLSAPEEAQLAGRGLTLGTAMSIVVVQDDVDHGTLTVYDSPMGPIVGAILGAFWYTPDPDFSGTDSFTYYIATIDINTLQVYVSNPATVTLNVLASNDAPVGADDTFVTGEDQTLNVNAPGVLANDTDVDGDALTAVLATSVSNGTLNLSGDGSFSYVPNANFNGNDSFTYNLTDGTSSTGVYTVDITVTDVPDAPVAANDTYVVDEDTSLTRTAANGLMNNDSHPDSDPIAAVLINGPSHGQLFMNTNGSFDYLAHPNYNGADAFTYYVTDGTNDSAPATVNITVVAVEDAPTVSPNFYATPEDTQLTVTAPGVLSDDYDADGDALSAVIGSASDGAVTLNADGSFVYTPVTDFTGTDEFTYTVTDGTTESETTTVTIVVGDVNDAPVAVNDVYSTGIEDEQLIIQAPGVLANDSDPEGDDLTAVLVQLPQHGTVNLLPTGRFVYTPFDDFNGTDSFTYQAFDGQLESGVATVTLNISADNDEPNASSDYYSMAEDGVLTITAPGVLANDYDPEGDTLVATLYEAPEDGSVTLNPDGSFVYTPNPNFAGYDEFEYEVTDGNGGEDHAYVEIYVTPVFDPAVTVDDNYTLLEDTTFDSGPVPSSVLSNDTYEGGLFSFGSVETTVFLHDDVDHGQLYLDEDTGFFDYTPDENFSGTDSFQYVIVQFDFNTFQLYISDPATVTFNVLPVNDSPVAVTDNFSTPEDTPLVVATTGVLSNDTDADGDALTAILQNNANFGIVSLNGDGGFVYTPNLNYYGPDAFTYYANDGTSISEVVTVTINVTSVNDPPVSLDDTFATDEDTTLSVFAPGVLQNDTDVDSTVLTATLVSQPLFGTVHLLQNGRFNYVPDTNYFGTDSFTYRAHDGQDAGNVATVYITIHPINDAPIGNEDNYGTFENVPLTVGPRGVLNNDVDVDGDTLTASQLTNPANGIISLAGDGSFTYTPKPGFYGVDSFLYVANDGLLSTAATTVTITVGEVNDPPVAQDDEYFVYEDTVTTIPIPGVLANDYDPEDEPLTATLIAGTSHGTVTLETSGSFTYTPNPNFVGQDQFTYQANDGVSDSNVATVIINVEPLNDQPLANQDYFSTDEEQELVVAAPAVLGNDFDDDGDDVLTAFIRDNPLHGVANLNADGSFNYIPDAGFFGEDVFTYHANDGTTNSEYTTVTILVRPINDAPVAEGDTYIADEDTSLTVSAPGVLANDTDDDGDVLSATLVLQPLNGTVFLNEDGSFEYLAYPNFNGTDSFIYKATDGLMNSNPVTVTITVRNVPDAPVANPDSYGTPENTPITINAPGVLADDYDLDGDPLTAMLDTNPSSGSLTLNSDGSFTYSPYPGANGADTFTYMANDGTTNSEITTVTIYIGAVNDAPVANDDLFNVFEDQVTTISAPGVLANDHDSDNTTLTASVITQPLYGTLVLNADGSFTYDPIDNYNGPDSFTYQANDGMLDSNVAIVSLNVVEVDDAPLANEDFFSTTEELSLQVAAPGVLGNDSDSDGTALSAILHDNPLSGTVVLNADGSFTYTPENGFSGVDRFYYRANDGNSNSDLTTVTITVYPRNDAPVAVNDTFIATEDTTLTVTALGVLQNDVDDDGDILAASLVVPPLHGTLTLFADGGFEYAAYPNYSGPDQFIYRATDGELTSNDAVVNITVAPVQDVPTGNADMYSTQENTPISIPAPGVLANDVDLDGDALTAIPVDYPGNGGLSLLSDGSFVYTPNTNFNGVDTFTYQATDTFSVSNITTVTINVGPVNDAPVARDDLYNVFEDMTTTVTAPGVLANDTDTDVPTTLSAILINGPLSGTVTLNADGSFIYTPMPNFNGVDSFTYQANDGLANSNVATVVINVVPVDDAPLANEDFFVVDEDQFITVAAPGVLGNDSDSDGSVLSVILQEEPPHGQLVMNADGSFTYTPDEGYFGDDYFTYMAHDGVSNSLPTTATIIVRPRNDRPTAFSDTFVTAEDTTLTVVAPGVLQNDTDDDNDVLSATLVVPPLHGTLALNADGSLTYEPYANFHGTDTFTYRATDGVEFSNEATATIIVTPAQDIPTANPDNYSTPEDTQLVVAAPGVLGDDVDLDGDALTAQLVDQASNGYISLLGDGSFVYTPNPGFFGIDTFTYKAFDGTSVSNVATVTINVGAVNDTPVANPDVYNLFEDDSSTVAAPGVLQNDTDGDDDVLTATLISSTLYGTLVFNQDGSFTYTPVLDFNGTDYFTYQANDGIADSNVTTVTLNVVPTADKPLANPDYYSTTEELELLVPTPGVLGNDFDADGQTLTSIIQDNPLNGVVTLNGDGSFSYLPNLGFSGTDIFTYVANDGTMNSDKTTVTITIHPRNDRPISVEDIYIATEDQPLTVPDSNGVLANDYDFDGDALTAVLINQPLNGTVALSGTGGFTYTPNLNFNGVDYFIYRAYDGQAYGNATKVTINVTPVQDPPVAVNDAYSIPEDKVLTVVGPGVLGNDYDFDNEPLTAHLVDAPEHGIISLNQNGSFVYTPDADFFGNDTFTYYANDGTENSNLATVTINVGGRNDNTVAVDDSYFTLEDVTLNIPAPGVLGNDVDVDGDPLTATIVTPPTRGTLTLNSDGSFQYIPETGFNGTVTFVYRANDGTGNSKPATVTITVGYVNDAPILTTATVTSPINENSFVALNADLFDEDATDTFLVSINWGDGSAPTILNLPAGTSKIFATHQYLDDNPTGTPVDVNNVTLTVQDNNGGADTENLTVTVNNLAPTLENVSLTQVVPTGGTARLQGTIKDVGTQDTFVMTVDWGDGNTEIFNHGPGASSFDYLHTYAVPGSYTVTVTVQDDDGGIITITPPILVRNTADLILTKTANPDPASVGELLTYTMTVTNFGPDMAHNVILMDTLPTNVAVTSSTPSMVVADGVCNWFLGDMPAGQTYRIDLIVKTLQQGPITNVATVVSNDLDPVMANNTASVTTTIGWLPDGPDLMSEAVTVDVICKLKKKGPKCTMKLRALVANRGTEDANSCIYSVYLSDDNIFSPTQDMKLKTKRFGKLKTGKVRAQHQNIRTPHGYTTTGKFMIVVLDEGNLVFEGNETNNLIIYGPLP